MKLALIAISLFTIHQAHAIVAPKVIYGQDNRLEALLFPDAEIAHKAHSVAGMVQKNRLVNDSADPTVFNFAKVPASRAYGLCPDERFADQPVLPVCTGFLVAPTILVTAGHCMESADDCENFSWAFGYTEGVERLPKQDVYTCQRVLERELSTSFGKVKDYAVIQLDRPVVDRAPLSFRRSGHAQIGTDLVVIGHPMGLPLKASHDAEISRMNWPELRRLISTLFRKRYYFLADLDTYGGNSGSPVFNLDSGEVEGLLIEGAEDFVFDQDAGCLRSDRRKQSRWVTEEKVMRITKIPYLERL